MADINVPSVTSDNVTLGQCVVYLDNYRSPSAAGVTPSTDIGAVDEVSMKITRTFLELKQGVPQLLIDQWCIDEIGEMTLKGWEWDKENWYKVLAAGATSTGLNSESYYDFGGDYTVGDVQIRIFHQMPSGATIYLDLWKASGNGELSFMFNPTDFNKIDYTFKIMRASADWVGSTLTQGQRMFKYTKIDPP